MLKQKQTHFALKKNKKKDHLYFTFFCLRRQNKNNPRQKIFKKYILADQKQRKQKKNYIMQNQDKKSITENTLTAYLQKQNY